MATKRGGGDQDPTSGSSARRTAGSAAGGGAAGKTTRGAVKPNGPAAPTGETGGPRRVAEGKATTGRTAGSTRAASGTRAAAGGKAAGGKAAEGATAGTGTKAAAGPKGTTRGTTRGAAKSPGSATTRGGGKKADLKKDLRDFASTRPEGWSHDDWLRFLDDLQARGHNISDRDQIGSLLEKERLSLALERIPGLSAQRARTIAERYGYLWRLKETDADQLASEANIPRPVAEKVLDGLRR